MSGATTDLAAAEPAQAGFPQLLQRFQPPTLPFGFSNRQNAQDRLLPRLRRCKRPGGAEEPGS
ncbi:MAG TPA: hypothetical protein VK420_17575, partial [Longimicrobium sp.]|nr:hypothetical protein [Longimicrobium sp.]